MNSKKNHRRGAAGVTSPMATEPILTQAVAPINQTLLDLQSSLRSRTGNGLASSTLWRATSGTHQKTRLSSFHAVSFALVPVCYNSAFVQLTLLQILSVCY